MRIGTSALAPWALALGLFFSPAAAAGPGVLPPPVPEALAVKGELPPPPDGVSDLKFKDFFKLPVGPRGFEPTPKLLGLDGRRVRMVGYLVRQEAPTAGLLYLSPFPIELGDEDESLADDLPPSTVFIHVATGGGPASYFPGLVKLTGRLSVGAKEEADGRVSSVRLIPDPELALALAGGGPDRKAPLAGAPSRRNGNPSRPAEKALSRTHPSP